MQAVMLSLALTSMCPLVAWSWWVSPEHVLPCFLVETMAGIFCLEQMMSVAGSYHTRHCWASCMHSSGQHGRLLCTDQGFGASHVQGHAQAIIKSLTRLALTSSGLAIMPMLKKYWHATREPAIMAARPLLLAMAASIR